MLKQNHSRFDLKMGNKSFVLPRGAEEPIKDVDRICWIPSKGSNLK